MDSHPFRSLHITGRDIIIVYDYSSPNDPDGDLLASLLKVDYDDICLIAWSFGVFHAARWLETHRRVPVTFTVAVNGTLYPVDETRGIDPSVFEATLAGLTPDSIDKFRFRMCGNRERYIKFSESAPKRDIDSLRAELEQMKVFSAGNRESAYSTFRWDCVFISEKDHIFSCGNQLNAWADHRSVTVIPNDAHMPDWQKFITRVVEMLLNKNLIAQRFGSVGSTYESHAIVQRNMAATLADMLPGHITGTVLEIGTGTGFLTRQLRNRLDPGSLLRLWDLAPLYDDVECLDAEIAIKNLDDESVDVIASSSTIQWFQSPGTFLRECLRVTKPGGYVAIATFGSGTYNEINSILGRTPIYPDIDGWRALASGSGWEDILCFSRQDYLEFDNPLNLLRHIRFTGVNALRSGCETVKEARLIVSELCMAERKPRLTYEQVFMLLYRK